MVKSTADIKGVAVPDEIKSELGPDGNLFSPKENQILRDNFKNRPNGRYEKARIKIKKDDNGNIVSISRSKADFTVQDVMPNKPRPVIKSNNHLYAIVKKDLGKGASGKVKYAQQIPEREGEQGKIYAIKTIETKLQTVNKRMLNEKGERITSEEYAELLKQKFKNDAKFEIDALEAMGRGTGLVSEEKELILRTVNRDEIEQKQVLILMEYLPGKALKNFIEENTDTPPQALLLTQLQIADTSIEDVIQLHRAGYYNCDLKPENFIFDPNTKTARIADFGSSRPIKDKKTGPFTFAYTAPELREGIIAYPTEATEMFSMGVMFAEIFGMGKLEGKTAFDTHLVMEDKNKFDNDPIRKEVYHFISRMVDEKPSNRPTAEEVSLKFKGMLQRYNVSKPKESPLWRRQLKDADKKYIEQNKSLLEQNKSLLFKETGKIQQNRPSTKKIQNPAITTPDPTTRDPTTRPRKKN